MHQVNNQKYFINKDYKVLIIINLNLRNIGIRFYRTMIK